MDNPIHASAISTDAGNSTEVAIIGGGVIGTAVAYYTAKSGLECMLIEREISPAAHPRAVKEIYRPWTRIPVSTRECRWSASNWRQS